MAPWRLSNHVLQIVALTGKLQQWQMQHTVRFRNNMADSLAKVGVRREHDLLLFHSV
ncbi:hypothetical protein POUND7_006072 [Theobroma cacao]